MSRQNVVLGGIVLLLAVAASCSQSTSPGAPDVAPPPGGLLLRGAGATFPAPLYKQWFAAYHDQHSKVAIAYDAVGSGVGIKRFIGTSKDVTDDERVDFGASDAALSDAEMAEVARGAQLVPMTAGAVALAYNLPTLKGDLKLSREVFSGIVLGKITTWNDPEIVKTNPELKDYHRTITLVVRQDGSGTTYALTNHLSAVSREWHDRFGAEKLVDWPGAAMRANGNAAVATLIQRSENSIGYVEFGFAKRLALRMAALENHAGRFIAPTADSASTALASAELPENLRTFFPDPDGPEAYPIVTLSWILLYQHYDDADKTAAIRDLFTWCLADGQKASPQLGYLPLPDSIATRATAAVAAIGQK